MKTHSRAQLRGTARSLKKAARQLSNLLEKPELTLNQLEEVRNTAQSVMKRAEMIHGVAVGLLDGSLEFRG